MGAVATAFCALLLFTAIVLVYVVANRQWPSGTMLLLGYAAFAQLLLTQLKFAGVSPKVPAFLLLGVLTGRALLVSSEARKSLRQIRHLLIPLCALGLWIPVHEWVAGRLTTEALDDVASNQGMSAIALVTTVVSIQRSEDLRFYAWVGVSTVLASVLTAYLQFFGFAEAWDAYQLLRPIAVEQGGARLLSAQLAGVPGLAQGAVQHAYMILVFGSFSLAYATLGPERTRGRRAAALFAFLILPPLLFVSRSRSGLWLSLALAVVTLLYVPFRYSDRSKKIAVALACFGGLLLMATVGTLEAAADVQGVSLVKLESIVDYGRLDIAASALDEIAAAPLIGIGQETFVTRYGILAHNALLNAILAYGALGGVLLLWFYYGLWRVNVPGPRSRRSTESSWIRTGALCGAAGYVVNGMFHNESIVTGGTLGAIAAALWACGCRVEGAETRALSISLSTNASAPTVHERGRGKGGAFGSSVVGGRKEVATRNPC
jgi:hypothetical protein